MPGPWQVGDRIADRFEVFEVHHGGMGIAYLVRDHLRQVRGVIVTHGLAGEPEAE